MRTTNRLRIGESHRHPGAQAMCAAAPGFLTRTLVRRGLMACALIMVAGKGCTHRMDPAAPAPARVSTADSPATNPPHAAAVSPIQLSDVTDATGITFVHTDGGCGQRCIIESVSAGLVLFDYDGDGWIDIYFLNGAPLPGTVVNTPPRNALYRNLGHWRFEDMTKQAGVGDTGYGLGAVAADFNHDGHPDLYLNNYGPNVLYRNNGDGTFTDVTAEAGVINGHKVGAGTCFLDIDNDGHLDLYVSNYVKLSDNLFQPFTMLGYPSYPGPNRFGAEPDTLYRSNGNGTFTDVSLESGVGQHEGTGMGMICFDYDDDGDTDIFICNDGRPNYLFENDGHGTFTEVAVTSGLAYDSNGDINGSMGADCGDYDNDGWIDLLRTNYQFDVPVLSRNLGSGFFEDVSLATGAGSDLYDDVTWGPGLVDFDNDGFRDLFIACGHLQDNVHLYDDTTHYRARNVVKRNTGDGQFLDVTADAGSGMSVAASSRGAAFDDLDNDGDVDVVILNSRAPPTILRNELPQPRHWLQVRLHGVQSNRDGVGARVRVAAGDLVQVAEVHSGRGYQGHFGTRLHFGLGPHDRVDQLTVRWLDGSQDIVHNIEADRCVPLVQGSGLIH